MKTPTRPSRRGVTLTRGDQASESGLALLQQLEEVSADGVITHDEAHALAAWLDAAAAATEVPGVHFLREELEGILADGVVSEPERRLLRQAILRVLPPTERDRARARFAEAADAAREARRKEEAAAFNRVTEAQRDYIAVLGGVCPDGASKDEASALITALLESRPTNRQLMVLRFWNRLDLSSAGVEGVSLWMDEWYAGDADRKLAWDLWKHEVGDHGRRSHEWVDSVPLGAGDEYLARVKAIRATQAERVAPRYTDDPSRTALTRGLLVVVGVSALLSLAVWLGS